MIHVKQLSIMVLIIIMAACKKEKTPAPTDDTITILQSGDWKLTAFTISPALNGITDVMQNIPPCAKDNLLQFKPNSIFYFDEGATKCDPSYPQIFSLPWKFADNETKLILGTDENAILVLTATTLKLRYTFEDAGVIYTEEDTYEH